MTLLWEWGKNPEIERNASGKYENKSKKEQSKQASNRDVSD